MNFQPIDAMSRRAMVIELIADRPADSIVTYDELEELLGVEKARCQSVVNQAKAGLEATHKKAIVAVPNQGYRITHANEHLTLAQSHQKRSVRQIARRRCPYGG